MPQPRSSLVSLSDTPWYHVVSRCVRRAYLCGEDAHSGRSFEHRRGWIAERLQQLAGVFAVDVAAYAVMSNHFHVVVRIDAERVRGWDADEVLRRWTRVFAGPPLVQRFLADRQALGAAETAAVLDWVETYRGRLADLSWYMRVLNESIARSCGKNLDTHLSCPPPAAPRSLQPFGARTDAHGTGGKDMPQPRLAQVSLQETIGHPLCCTLLPVAQHRPPYRSKRPTGAVIAGQGLMCAYRMCNCVGIRGRLVGFDDGRVQKSSSQAAPRHERIDQLRATG
jgi:hypothetical protein